MSEDIFETGTKTQIDSYLKNTYGHELAKFELSYLNTCYLFKDPNLRAKSKRLRPREKERLNRLKRRLIELFEDYLQEVGFYNYTQAWGVIKRTGFKAWTTENKEAFIERYFKLESTLSLLDRASRWLSINIGRAEIVPHTKKIGKNIRISPLNLLILIWSEALKRNSRTSWKDMSGLLARLSRNYKSPALNKCFHDNTEGRANSYALRLSWNRYRDSRYRKVAHNQYEAIFELQTGASLISLRKDLYRLINKKFYTSAEQVSNVRATLIWMMALFPEIYGSPDDFWPDEDV